MLGIKRLFCNPKKQRFALIFAVFSVIMAMASAAIFWSLDWQYISDTQKASNFTPSAEIATVADNLQLTRRGRAAFYAAQPTLLDKASFNVNCGNDGDSTYMLGCYLGGKNERINLYNIGAETINENGVHYDFAAERDTTALHELLHGIYARLDSRKQQSVCRAAKSFVEQTPDLKDSLKYYSDSLYCTEAFARIGSEYADRVSGILATTFAKYFSVNTDLITRHQQNEKQLSALAARTAESHKKLSVAKGQLNTSIAAYRASLTYGMYYSVNTQIDNYNTMVSDYNALVKTYKKIVSALDSAQ